MQAVKHTRSSIYTLFRLRPFHVLHFVLTMPLTSKAAPYSTECEDWKKQCTGKPLTWTFLAKFLYY
jgi:hypothetical protein